MKNYKPYLIKLFPTNEFYFGSEQNFSGGQNYFAVSRKFPQQSTLLGVLRYKILEANNLLSSDYGKKVKDLATNMIGPEGFNHTSDQNIKDYGDIGAITPLSIYDGKKYYYVGNRDRGFKGEGHNEDQFDLKFSNELPNLHGYNIKSYYPDFLVDGEKNAKSIANLFVERTQVGIYRTNSRFSNQTRIKNEDEEKGFYKKTSWVFYQPEMCFTFFAWLSESTGNNLVSFTNGSQILTPIGGERSLFRMHVEQGEKESKKWKEQIYQVYKNDSDFHRVVLISDAYVFPSEIYKTSLYAITKPIPFRFMTSKVLETENYFALEDSKSKSNKYIRKSHLLQLMAAGSVFFINDSQLDDFKNTMDQYKAHRQIGHNHYLILKNDNKIIYEPFKFE
ncbi:MAG: hypothetical protein IPP06_09590 [Saprospiraceae bacterium]|nr:hypothetical protein [Candidatus Vicinibacter affinis]